MDESRGTVMSPDPEWLSTARTAQRLGITPRTLYRFVTRGEITAYRLGRVIRFQQQDVDAFIDNRRITPSESENPDPDAAPPDH
jgi:excisionase family DNA binding protein